MKETGVEFAHGSAPYCYKVSGGEKAYTFVARDKKVILWDEATGKPVFYFRNELEWALEDKRGSTAKLKAILRAEGVPNELYEALELCVKDALDFRRLAKEKELEGYGEGAPLTYDRLDFIELEAWASWGSSLASPLALK